MNKETFNKKIEITILSSAHYEGFSYNSILYTPIKYRIPVDFADTSNSIDDTDKYIKENYTKEQQQIIKNNSKTNTNFLNELMRIKITDESVQKLVEKYEKNFIPFEYTPPDTLRNLNVSDNIKDLNGYLVLDANAILTPIGETLVEFLNLNFDIFEHFFIFFTKFFGTFINNFSNEELNDFKIDELTDINYIKSLAEKSYSINVKILKDTQRLFRDFIDFVYNINNIKSLNNLTLKQRFYIFYTANQKELSTFSSDYTHDGLYNFKYSEKLKYTNIDELISKVKALDPDGNKISTANQITSDNIFTMFYISLYHLVLDKPHIISKCKNCNKYFITTKTNTFYCDNIFYNNKTCRDMGNQRTQKKKQTTEPVYGRYRNIFSTKSRLLKTHPDIYSKEKYEKWKKEASQFMQDIREGKKTYEEFDKWLDKNK